MAGPLLARARARGERVAVVVVTNGDYACSTSGFVRERETLAAMDRAGVPHEQVHFLGYPDGGLELLASEPLRVRRLDETGACVEGSTTYASPIERVNTVSVLRKGQEGAYVREGLLEDLAWLLERYRPNRVVTAHPADDHPDHAATGLAVLAAVERARVAPPKLSFSFVHLGPDYPAEDGDGASGVARASQPMRSLPEEFRAIVPEERVAWPEGGAFSMAPLLASYTSQLGASPSTNWLQSFDRADVPLYASPFVCAGSPRVCADPRFEGRGALTVMPTAEARAWPQGSVVSLATGEGLTFRAGAKHYRLCMRREASGDDELLVHDLTAGEELERRFAGVRGGRVEIRWAPEASGVAHVALADARGAFGRRLMALRGPLTVARATTCSDVP